MRNRLQKIAFAVFVVSVGVSIGSAWVTIRSMEQLSEKTRRDTASMEYANARIRDKIFAGGYEGMTKQQLEAQVKEDYEFFVLSGRTELDDELGEIK